MERSEATEKKILVVDTDVTQHERLARLLAGERFEVTTARSAPDAWERLHIERPHLILLETMLPTGTEGFHFVWRLRGHGDTLLARTPIVIVSRIHKATTLNLFPDLNDGHYTPHEFLPIQAFFNKPVDHDHLMRTISELVNVGAALTGGSR